MCFTRRNGSINIYSATVQLEVTVVVVLVVGCGCDDDDGGSLRTSYDATNICATLARWRMNVVTREHKFMSSF